MESKQQHHLPASGGLYSRSNQESAYDFHPQYLSSQYLPNQPSKETKKYLYKINSKHERLVLFSYIWCYNFLCGEGVGGMG